MAERPGQPWFVGMHTVEAGWLEVRVLRFSKTQREGASVAHLAHNQAVSGFDSHSRYWDCLESPNAARRYPYGALTQLGRGARLRSGMFGVRIPGALLR